VCGLLLAVLVFGLARAAPAGPSGDDNRWPASLWHKTDDTTATRLRRAFSVRESLLGLPADFIAGTYLYWREVECPPLEALLPDVHWYLADVASDQEFGSSPPCWAVAEHGGVLYRYRELNALLAAVGWAAEADANRAFGRVAVFFYLLHEEAERVGNRSTRFPRRWEPADLLPDKRCETGTSRFAYDWDSEWRSARRKADSLNEVVFGSTATHVAVPEVDFLSAPAYGFSSGGPVSQSRTPDTLRVAFMVRGTRRDFELLVSAGKLDALMEAGLPLVVYQDFQPARQAVRQR
jgi:hypothetical protein